MIEGYEWVGWLLFDIGLFGISFGVGFCFFRLLNRSRPPDKKEDHD